MENPALLNLLPIWTQSACNIGFECGCDRDIKLALKQLNVNLLNYANTQNYTHF